MATDPKPKPTEPFFHGDRATAPAALEESSALVWQQFEALQRGEKTTPAAARLAPPGATQGGWEPTQLQEPGPQGDSRPPPKELGLDLVMLLARRNNRACPVPEQWSRFHQLLPLREMHGRVLVAPLPLVGAEWASASPMQKRLRLREQLEWAERMGALPAVHEFLSALPEAQWHHFSG